MTGKRLEVRFGAFACIVEGYDDPSRHIREVLTVMQQLVADHPTLIDGTTGGLLIGLDPLTDIPDDVELSEEGLIIIRRSADATPDDPVAASGAGPLGDIMVDEIAEALEDPADDTHEMATEAPAPAAEEPPADEEPPAPLETVDEAADEAPPATATAPAPEPAMPDAGAAPRDAEKPAPKRPAELNIFASAPVSASSTADVPPEPVPSLPGAEDGPAEPPADDLVPDDDRAAVDDYSALDDLSEADEPEPPAPRRTGLFDRMRQASADAGARQAERAEAAPVPNPSDEPAATDEETEVEPVPDAGPAPETRPAEAPGDPVADDVPETVAATATAADAGFQDEGNFNFDDGTPRPPDPEPEVPADRLDELMERLRGLQASRPPQQPRQEESEEHAPHDAADLAARAGATEVDELLAACAAWLTLAEAQDKFSRREVMDVFDTLPGDHPRSVEEKIKGYGKLVRAGTLALAGDGVFTMAPADVDRFRGYFRG